MDNFKQLMKQKNRRELIKNILASKYIVVFSAAFFLFTYYLGLDIAAIWYMGIIGSLMMWFLDDLTPLAGVMPFMHIMITAQHSPSITLGGSGYFFSPAIYVQIIVVIAIYAFFVFWRIYRIIRQGKIKLNNIVIISLIALSVAFLLNGLASEKYIIMDLAYGAIMMFFFFVFAIPFMFDISVTKENLSLLAHDFAVFSGVLLIELVVGYCTQADIIVDGSLNKEAVVFGWGIWNTMGMLIALCMPFVFYNAVNSKKYSYLWFLYASVLMVASVMTTSRAAMLTSAILYAVCWVILLIYGSHRRVNIIISVVLIAALVTVLVVFNKKLLDFFEVLLVNLKNPDGTWNGNGRMAHIMAAIEDFKSNVLFGVGFFGYKDDYYAVGLDNIIPIMYCNTFAEMLGACGLLGITTYIFYRGVTIWKFIKNFAFDKIFVALSVGGLLFISMFDNHMFYILPNMIYCALLPFVINKPKLSVLPSRG